MKYKNENYSYLEHSIWYEKSGAFPLDILPKNEPFCDAQKRYPSRVTRSTNSSTVGIGCHIQYFKKVNFEELTALPFDLGP